MNIKGAIFDLDGTLLDSMWLWHEIDDTYIRNKGKIPAPDLCRALATKNMEQSVEYFQTVYGIDDPAEVMAAELWGMAEQAYYERVPLKEHVYDFLMELKARKIRCYVATASNKAFSIAALKRCGVWDCFEGIVTCDEIGSGKERPDVFFAAQKALGLPQEQIILFEDALHAVQTAKLAGFTVAAVYDKDAEPDEPLIRETADYYLQTMKDFPLP